MMRTGVTAAVCAMMTAGLYAGEGLFHDAARPLVWQDDLHAKTGGMSWDDARRYCENLSLEGVGGWRLPSKDELQGLFPQKGGLTHVSLTNYWASLVDERDTGRAWYVNFFSNRTYSYLRETEFSVRCVREKER